MGEDPMPGRLEIEMAKTFGYSNFFSIRCSKSPTISRREPAGG